MKQLKIHIEKEKLIKFFKKTWKLDGQVNLNHELYYVKKLDPISLVNELLSEIIATEIGIETPILKIGTYAEQLLLLSKDFKNKKEYENGGLYSPKEYGDRRNFNIKEYEIFLKEVIELKEENFFLDTLIKISLFDLYRNEQDRTRGNYYFEKENLKHVVLLDHSLSFSGETKRRVYNEQFETYNIKELIPYIKKNEELKELLNQLIQTNPSFFLEKLEQKYPIFLEEETKEYYLNEMKKSIKLLKTIQKQV